MTDVLVRIVEGTRARLGEERFDWTELRRSARERADAGRPFAFSAALKNGHPVAVIAEIKSASPSAGSIVENPAVEQIAAEYQRGGAAAISVVTEPEVFHGSRHLSSPAPQ